MRVFITGASTGIGQALARHYAAQGAILGLVARRESLLQELVGSLPGEHACYALDVRAVHEDGRATRGQAPDSLAAGGSRRRRITFDASDPSVFRLDPAS